MNILVTGSAGFIGKHLVERLDGHLIYFIDQKNGFNINDPKVNSDLMKEDLDFIFHLAGDCSTSRSIVNPTSAFLNNTLSTANVLEIARVKDIPIIFTSTCKTKAGKDGSRTPYGASKYMAELWALEFINTYGISCVINKPGTIYGSGQDASAESGWLSWFIKASIENKPVTVFGDGEQSRDVLHVSDYVNLMMDQFNNMDKYKGRTHSVGGGVENELTLNETIKMLGINDVTYTKERQGDVKRFVSRNKVSEVNGWKPKMNYRDGIKLTKEYYE